MWSRNILHKDILLRINKAHLYTICIGENTARVREQCCAGMEALGITLDRERNASMDSKSFDIHGEASPVSLLVYLHFSTDIHRLIPTPFMQIPDTSFLTIKHDL